MSKFKQGTVDLEKMQRACELLRRTLRFVALVKRLEKHLEQVQIPQAARCLVELSSLEDDASIREILVVKDLLVVVEQAKLSVRTKASSLLMDGMQSQTQQDVMSALLAFSAIGLLRDKVKTAVSITSNKARRVIDAGIGSDESKDQWPVFESTLSELHDLCLSIWHLQFVLVKVKDPNSGLYLWDSSGLKSDQDTLTEPFWVQLSAKLSGVLTLPARRSLQRDYPRLYRALHDFARKSMSSYEMLQLQHPHRIMELDAFESLLKPLSSLSVGHLNRTKRRFKKVSDGIFVPKPSEEKSLILCRAFAREIIDARDVSSILELVTVEICSTTKVVIQEGLKRVEKNVSFLNVATPTQQHLLNASVCNTFLAIEGSLTSLLYTLQRDWPKLSEAIEICRNGQITIFQPLSDAFKSNVAAGHFLAFKNAILPLYKSSKTLKTLLDPICSEFEEKDEVLFKKEEAKTSIKEEEIF